MGYYGIFTATVGYAIYFVGLDFYTYVTREILKAPHNQRGALLKGQAALSGFLYLFFLPFALVFLSYADWPDNLAWWFFPILLLEHFNQEISRLLIALSEQITATFILFIRQGSWAIAIVALMTLEPDSRRLGTVMILWGCAGLGAAALGIWKLRQLRISGWSTPVDWAWVKKGVAISTAFLAATLALRGFQTLDRYWLEALGGIELVGAYVLLLGIAGTMIVFLDAGIFAYTYPALISHNHNREYTKAHQEIKKTLFQTIIFCLFFSIFSWLLLPYLLNWIENPVYKNAQHWYPWLLLAMSLNAVSMVPHYGLYARGHDKPLIFSHIAALIAFIVSTWILSYPYASLAIAMGLNASFAMILIWKSVAYWQIIKATPEINTSS